MKKLILVALMMIAGGAFAHSGGTDKMGCRRDHTTGVYHCH